MSWIEQWEQMATDLGLHIERRSPGALRSAIRGGEQLRMVGKVDGLDFVVSWWGKRGATTWGDRWGIRCGSSLTRAPQGDEDDEDEAQSDDNPWPDTSNFRRALDGIRQAALDNTEDIDIVDEEALDPDERSPEDIAATRGLTVEIACPSGLRVMRATVFHRWTSRLLPGRWRTMSLGPGITIAITASDRAHAVRWVNSASRQRTLVRLFELGLHGLNADTLAFAHTRGRVDTAWVCEIASLTNLLYADDQAD